MASTVNVERMRRYIARNREAAQEREWQQRLATMTPEHRAKHEKPLIGWCGECLRAGWR